MGDVSDILRKDSTLYENALMKLKVGVHTDTEVSLRSKDNRHRVHQVYASAVPVA